MSAHDDLQCIQRVIHDEPGAWEAFVQRFGDVVYTQCAKLFSPVEAPAQHLDVFRKLQADSFAVLRQYNGQAPFTMFLSFTLRDILGQRIRELFEDQPALAWEAFQRLFQHLFEPLRQRDEDLYQEVCLRLIENNYHRILGFDRRGSFPAYIRKVIDNICLDLRRHTEGRRRLPAAVQRLGTVEQEIFKRVHWQGCRESELGELLRTPDGSPYPPEIIKAALSRQAGAGFRPSDAPRRETPLPTLGGDQDAAQQQEIPDVTYVPEKQLLDAEQQQALAGYVAVLQEALAHLPADLALYVRLRFYNDPPKAPQEIARLMNRSERDIYKIRQEAMASLKTVFTSRGLAKNPDLSV